MQKILREVGKKLPTSIRKKIAVSVIAKSERIKHESKIKSLNLRPFHKRQLLFTRSFDHYFFDEMMHVPLIFCGYGFKHIKPIKKLTRTIDIFPTIIDSIGLESPKKIDGQSLLPLTQGHKIEELPAFMERDVVISHSEFDVEGIRTQKYKYFRSVINSKDNVHLYDLETDPLEENNIGQTHPNVVNEMEQILRDIKQNEPINNSQKVLDKEHEDKVREELRKLGYL